LAVSIPITTW